MALGQFKERNGVVLDRIITALRPIRFRGKLRLLNRLVPRQGERDASVFGYRITLDLQDEVQRQMYLGVFEPKETRWALDRLQPGQTFVDVGANVGYFTLLAARTVGPTGCVVAIEPSPYAFARLETTVRGNQLTQVRPVRCALGSEHGTVLLYVPPASWGNHSPTMVPTPGWEPVPTDVLTLDHCMSDCAIETVDLLKMDVEGYETHVLRGATRCLTDRRIRAVLCEFNDHWLRGAGSSPEELYNVLIESGFVDVDGNSTFASGCIETRFFVQ